AAALGKIFPLSPFPPRLRRAPEKRRERREEEEGGRGRAPTPRRPHAARSFIHDAASPPSPRRRREERIDAVKNQSAVDHRASVLCSINATPTPSPASTTPSRRLSASSPPRQHSLTGRHGHAVFPRRVPRRRALGSSEDPKDLDYFDDVDYTEEKDKDNTPVCELQVRTWCTSPNA
ncbi:unnamed protein product, partial [Urochloa humidicola]